MAMLARKLRSLRPEQVLEVDVDKVDEVDEQSPEQGLSRGWCLGLLVAWAFIFSTAVAVEPPPAHPNAPEPLAAILLSTVLFGAWAVMGVGLLARHVSGAKAPSSPAACSSLWPSPAPSPVTTRRSACGGSTNWRGPRP